MVSLFRLLPSNLGKQQISNWIAPAVTQADLCPALFESTQELLAPKVGPNPLDPEELRCPLRVLRVVGEGPKNVRGFRLFLLFFREPKTTAQMVGGGPTGDFLPAALKRPVQLQRNTVDLCKEAGLQFSQTHEPWQIR